MKGRYRGYNEGFEKTMTVVMAIALIVSILLNLVLKSDEIKTLASALFGVTLIAGLLSTNFPCGFKTDDTGFTIWVVGKRKRYDYDDIASVSETHYIKTFRTRGGGEYYRTVVKLTVKDRNGNTDTYTEMSSINMNRPYAAGSFDKLPQLIKLCGYLQEQTGFHAQAEETLRPPKVMTSGGGISVDYPAPEKPKPQPRMTAAVQSEKKSEIGYYMGFRKNLANTYQIIAALILPVNFFMMLIDYTAERYLTIAGMIAAIIIMIRLSVNPPCKFTADEDGFAITTGKYIHKYEYGEIESVSCKVHSRLLNKSFIVLTIKKQGGKVCYCESSRFSNWQILNDPSAGVPELIRLGKIIEQAKAARGNW